MPRFAQLCGCLWGAGSARSDWKASTPRSLTSDTVTGQADSWPRPQITAPGERPQGPVPLDLALP